MELSINLLIHRKSCKSITRRYISILSASVQEFPSLGRVQSFESLRAFFTFRSAHISQSFGVWPYYVAQIRRFKSLDHSARLNSICIGGRQ